MQNRSCSSCKGGKQFILLSAYGFKGSGWDPSAGELKSILSFTWKSKKPQAAVWCAGLTKAFFGWPWFPDSLTGFFLLGLWCGSASLGLIFIASVICVSRTINSSVCVPGLVSETVGWIPLRSQICGQIFHIKLSARINQGDIAWKLSCQSFWSVDGVR